MRQLGNLKLHLVSDGLFKLDGGAMFGVIPKPLWVKQKPADERNRVTFGTNCLLVEAGDRLVLVDTGLGDKHDAKFLDIYDVDAERTKLPESIAAAGFELGDVTDVLLSHLHFDHCGWNTRRNASGTPVPTFPKARYWLERGEVEHARHPTERDRASYFPENYEPLFTAGVVELYDGGGERGAEVAPGVRAVKAPGHNADMCVIELDGGAGARGAFWADLFPTVAHVPLPWIMAYDLYPLTTLASKKSWLPRAVRESWLGFFEHDAETPWARIVEEKPGRFATVPVEETGAS